uniref:Fucosyltransferase n=1 Tax=Manihot esculenta TaxID=3983 RepID=A0A2C9UWW5_MANES
MRTWNLVACLVAFLTILLLSVIFQHNMFDVVGVFAKVKALRGKAQNVTQIGSGLGNRILNMASAFLYALLTNRVLLVEHETDMADLFCQPFPNTSWLLPLDFPVKNELRRLNQHSPNRYGNLLRNNIINASTVSPPSLLYLFLAFNCDDYDKLFYCDDQQMFLQKIPWLIVKSDEYFIPFLFLIPTFKQELDKMFPDKETVFHHLGRYLFHPSNKAWGLITRFYQSYLAKADERIGIQIRVFDPKASPFEVVIDQILACTLKEKLLPEVDKARFIASPSENRTSKAILIASLYPEFYDNIRNIYWTFPTLSGEVIGVYQPSHEQYQHFGDSMHNMKAWVEMNLLSLSDVLVTSSWSTFGYVAQALGGLNPWILYKPENQMTPNPPCRKAISMEPCFHFAPSFDCKAKANADMGTIFPHVKHCEDATSGLKLVNDHSSHI